LPIGVWSIVDWSLFFDLIKPREIIPDNIHYQRLLDRVSDSATIDLDFGSFPTSPLFSICGGPNGAIISSMYPRDFIVRC
jgi:hypothetical protein